MGDVSVRLYLRGDIEDLTGILGEAWRYYVQDADNTRIKELLEYYLEDDTTRFWVATEKEKLIGVAQVVLKESFRCFGEEGRLELLFIRDTADNYYDVHTALMDAIFEFLRGEGVEFLRIDTTLENADVLFV